MNRRGFWSSAVARVLGLLGIASVAKASVPVNDVKVEDVYASMQRLQAVPRHRPPMAPRELLRAYLGLPEGCELCDLHVCYSHPEIDGLVLVTRAKLFWPGSVLPHPAPNVPLQPGYVRKKFSVVTSVYEYIMKIEAVDQMVHMELPG